ncbi:putative PPE family protein PPE38 [Mycobacterium simulans]|uniref:Putative PPE family protein PPE38 n=1 Tax=Mycobacterium simulans TaxID=627089 RepID=A0A7Z7N9W1_9MYCO|nr:PPE family protein [Mycobacterium simulans]SOJ54247.1 putative PPE family protein PPE38 [Mycobacterium simulans]
MILDFAWLAPEINSARIFGGAGSSPLFAAATAWAGLGADLQASASVIQSVLTDLTGGPWTGPASVVMAAATAPYVSWLTAAAAHAELSAAQAQVAGTAFETALAATVHPAAVAANRVSLLSLIATNFLGQNTPAIAATEFDYMEMWAQDVAAMLGYDAEATSVIAALTPFSEPPADLAGTATTAAAAVAPVAQQVAAASPAAPGAVSSLATVLTAAQEVASWVPVSLLMSLAQIGMVPASMLLGPLMQLGSTANASAAGLAGSAATELAAGVPKFVGDTATAMKGLSGGGVGAGMSAGLSQARLVGPMSVPPTWPGSVPAGMASSAIHRLSTMAGPTAVAEVPASPVGGGMPMMPMPAGMGGAGAGMPGAMMGRGGAGSHVVQQRPSVIPRAGVG